MLRQELKFIRAMSNIKLPPNFIRELGKAVVVDMKKAVAVSTAIAKIASALLHQSGVGSEALTFRDPSQLPLTKKEAEELPSPDWPPELAMYRPVRWH